MKKFFCRSVERLIAVVAIITSRTFQLTYSYNHPDEKVHRTDACDVREEDYN